MIRNALAFCVPRKSFIRIIALLAMGELILYAFYHFLAVPIFNVLIAGILLGFPLLFILALHISSTIVIRKDCYECLLGFHIIAHEQAHLRLNSLNEVFVEEETLKQTGNKLIPILLSNPTMCKRCFFKWRKIYCQATEDYLQKSQHS